MTYRHLSLEVEGARRRVLLDGGPLTLGAARELSQIATDLAEQRGAVRVLTIASQGADFCPGPADDLDPLTAGVDPPAAIASLPFPVVVALDGRVDSVGLEIALAADLRIGGPRTRVSLTDVTSVGASARLPCWGGTQRLPRLAGRSVASSMLLAGTELDHSAAHRCGLLQLLADDPDTLADTMSTRLAELAPYALSAAKEALARGPELPMRHALELEGDLNHLLQTTHDRAEGLAAFFDKRTPRFEGS
ncbi:MAG: enoyl-CoA hydratase/isomerase family protein [Ilumatobacteraceae bacterium]